MAIANGSYIIRSALDENLVLYPAGGSKAAKASVEAGAFSETDNRCYWQTAISGSSNKIWNLNTGSGSGNLSAAKGAIAGASAIQMGYAAATGLWTATASGTMVVNGVTVNTVTLQWIGGSNYLTVPDNGGNLTIQAATGEANQLFYLEPATNYNAKLGTPSGIATAAGLDYVADATSFIQRWMSSVSLLTWQMRYRTRQADTSGVYGDWTDWMSLVDNSQANSGWGSITATKSVINKQTILTSSTAVPVPTVDNTTYTAAQIETQLRVVKSTQHGPAVSAMITAYKTPTIAISSAVYSPDGIALTYITDYTQDGSAITIDSIVDGTTVILQDYVITGQDYTGTIYIPADSLYSVPSAGDSLVVTATIRSANQAVQKTVTVTLTLSYASGSGLAITPTYSLTDRLTYLATIAAHDTDQCFLKIPNLDGTYRFVECTLMSSSSTQKVFEIPGLFNQTSSVLWICQSGTSWVSKEDTVPMISTHYFSWYWYDNSGSYAAILKYKKDDPITAANSMASEVNKFVTTGREYPTFRYGKTIDRTLDIEGAILYNDTADYYTAEWFEKLMQVHHAVFRQPDGKWFDTAIQSVDIAKAVRYKTVSVKQEAETR